MYTEAKGGRPWSISLFTYYIKGVQMHLQIYHQALGLLRLCTYNTAELAALTALEHWPISLGHSFYKFRHILLMFFLN